MMVAEQSHGSLFDADTGLLLDEDNGTSIEDNGQRDRNNHLTTPMVVAEQSSYGYGPLFDGDTGLSLIGVNGTTIEDSGTSFGEPGVPSSDDSIGFSTRSAKSTRSARWGWKKVPLRFAIRGSNRARAKGGGSLGAGGEASSTVPKLATWRNKGAVSSNTTTKEMVGLQRNEKDFSEERDLPRVSKSEPTEFHSKTNGTCRGIASILARCGGCIIMSPSKEDGDTQSSQSSSCPSRDSIEELPAMADTVHGSAVASLARSVGSGSVAGRESVAGLTHVNSSVTWDGPEAKSHVSIPASRGVGHQPVANPMSNVNLVSTSKLVAQQVLASTVNTFRENYEVVDQLSQQLIFPIGNEAAPDGMQHPVRCDHLGVQDTNNMPQDERPQFARAQDTNNMPQDEPQFAKAQDENNMLQDLRPPFAEALEPAMLPMQHEDNTLALMRRRGGGSSQPFSYQTSRPKHFPGRYDFSSQLPAPIPEEKSVLGMLYESDTFDSGCGLDMNDNEDKYAACMRR